MASDTWGTSWGGTTGAWLASWARAAAAPSPGIDAGGRYTGKTFTRERWRKIREAEEALLAAEQRAIDTKAEEKRLQILEATRLAQEALDQAQETEISLAKLTAALEGAARAKNATRLAASLRSVTAAAKAIIKAAEEEDEADIELLLLH